MNIKPELYFFQNGGEMGELIRNYDWNSTSLGSPENWPKCLQTMVSVMLDNPFGMYIAWGDDYIQIYNDAYRPILGSTKHPEALGLSTRQTFKEIWHIIGSMFDDVMKGEPVGFSDFRLTLNRNGFQEKCYFDFAYCPIRKENGEVGGVLVTVIETTNRKFAEEELKKSEAKFRTMADNIPNLAWMANAEGWIFWYNKKWYDYTGTTPKQMEGWGWQSVHDPKQLPLVMERWQKCIVTGEPFEMVFPLKGADNNFRQFLTRVLPVYNNGELTQWFGTNTDITLQIEAEQSAKESEERFKTMAESIDILIATGDESRNATYFNKAWTDLTGRSVESLLNFGWADLINPEERQGFIDTYVTAFAKHEPWTGEFRVINKDGVYRWLLAKGHARFRPDGTFAGYISSSIDITERKIAEKAALENEQNLRNTILQAPVAMCILKGEDHVVELANERMFELWGRTSEELIHKPIFVGLPEAKDQGIEALLNGVYKTGKTFSAQGVPINLPRNNKVQAVYVNFVYEAFRDSDHNITGVLAVAIDVTAQVIAQHKIEETVLIRTKELADANSKLKKSNAELAQFAYIASHDLQEPVRKISIYTQMLENGLREQLDDKSRKFINKITSATSGMNTLIRDVLTYSELVNDKEAFASVDLNLIMESIKSDYDLLIEQKGATFEYINLPTIEAIPLQMTQLFSNLLGNALKFVRKDINPVIKISTVDAKPELLKNVTLLPDHEYCIIQFTDNGIGFAGEYSSQIFNIFQRLHRKSEFEGTGIGLAMCKKIALNHHGDINADGSSENGAVFNIIMPLKK